jgi:hypothetical protein
VGELPARAFSDAMSLKAFTAGACVFAPRCGFFTGRAGILGNCRAGRKRFFERNCVPPEECAVAKDLNLLRLDALA